MLAPWPFVLSRFHRVTSLCIYTPSYVPEKDKFPQAIPIKCCLVSHRPTDPFFSKSKNKIIPDSSSLNSVLNLQAHNLVLLTTYWYDVMSLSFINIDTTLFRHFHSRKDHVFELISYILARPFLGPRPLQVFILFFFLARPTDPPSRETGRWEKKHFIGVASVKKKH